MDTTATNKEETRMQIDARIDRVYRALKDTLSSQLVEEIETFQRNCDRVATGQDVVTLSADLNEALYELFRSNSIFIATNMSTPEYLTTVKEFINEDMQKTVDEFDTYQKEFFEKLKGLMGTLVN